MITLPPEDLSPSLLEYIVKQQELIAQLQARIEVLENEIIRLKKLNPKPNIKPNTKPPDDSGSDDPPDSGDSGSTSTDSSGNDDAPDRKSVIDKPDDSTRKKGLSLPALLSLKNTAYLLKIFQKAPSVMAGSRSLFRSWR